MPPRRPRSTAARPRHTRSQTTQERILDTARRHFERDGFEGASIRAMASDAGVATGTVLLHFADKKGLLHAALHDALEKAIVRCLAVRRRGSIATRLSGVARHFYAYYAERPTLSRTLLRESLFADDPWRERLAAQAALVTTHVAGLVEQAKTDGELPRTTDARVVSLAFCSFYYLALIAWAQGSVDDPLELFRTLMTQHLAGARA